MKELVRCRPCGYVMEKDKLGDVCPACGLPHKVFEPYREKVSLNRLFVLNLDLPNCHSPLSKFYGFDTSSITQPIAIPRFLLRGICRCHQILYRSTPFKYATGICYRHYRWHNPI